MNMTTLEYFVALAQAPSINQAAQQLYISQSSLTRAIQSMEKELGIPLFYRDKSGITLTEAGQQILPEAREMLKYYQGWKKLAGRDTLRQICAAVDIPVVAIGGITEENLPELAGTGVDGVALVSAIFSAPDIEARCRRLRALAEQAAQTPRQRTEEL